MRFYLGTHQPHWVSWPRFAGVPLFVSDARLRERKSLPLAITDWALDSGAFSEIKEHGRWRQSPQAYATRVVRYQQEMGRMQWAATQDWMCEPIMLAKTGLSIEEHQRRTTSSFLLLRMISPKVPWAPTLQGWDPDDYIRHANHYLSLGVDLRAEPIVGVGSVCKRQGTDEIVNLFRRLRQEGLRLHGFGVKTAALSKGAAHSIASADSMAWSFQARREKIRLEGCTTHKNCANCADYALLWYHKIRRLVDQSLVTRATASR